MNDVLDTPPRRAAARARQEPASLSDQAVARLREMIVLLEIAPGAVLSEPHLTATLGASRTPVREALKLLAAEGLVLLRRNRAAIVAPLDETGLNHLFEVEVALESHAAGLAATRMSQAALDQLVRLQIQLEDRHRAGDWAGYIRINQRIHSAVVEGAANPALADTHARILGRLTRARNVGLSSQGRMEESIAEHRAILLALQARDADLARRLFAAHVERTGELVARHCAAQGRTAPRRRRAGR